MRPRINPIRVQGEMINARKVVHFVNKPLHILCLELTKSVAPYIGRYTIRKEEEVVYKTRVRVAV